MKPEYRIDTAVVLAGGLGTRLRSVVPDLPKPMAPIGDRPFLECQLNYWIDQGIRHFVVSVGYLHEVITSHFGPSYRGAKISYVVESHALGTGGALLLAYKSLRLNKPFLLLNGDTYFAVQLSVLESFFEAHEADWCFSLFTTTVQGRYMGMNIDSTDRIVTLGTDSRDSGQLANGGVYIVHPNALDRFCKSGYAEGVKISLEDDIFPAALSIGQRLFGMTASGLFIDIGVPEDYERAQLLLSFTNYKQ